MFEAGSQDFCSRAGLDKRLGFIDFCAVHHDFLSALAFDLAALRAIIGSTVDAGSPSRGEAKSGYRVDSARIPR